jgi:hypothetical protein
MNLPADGPAPSLDASPTQIQRSLDDRLDNAVDIGRPVGNHTRELFVSCEPGEAVQQQFEYLRPSYIALHDIAGRSARRLLHAIASAAGRPVERLSIRRQSYGTVLASVDYVDCPASRGQRVRLYSTDTEADSATRASLARVLLAHATQSVVLVGDVPAHALSDALQPLRDAMFRPDWHCAYLQFMPLATSSHAALAGLVAALGPGSGVVCQIAPRVSRPVEAWGFVSESWNRLQTALHPDGTGPQLSTLAAGRETLHDLPDLGAATSPAPLTPLAARAHPVERFVLEAHALPGVQSACVFHVATSRVAGHAGAAFLGSDLARRGALLLAAGTSTRRQLHLAGQADEVLVMGGSEALGVRTLQSQPGLALHLVYDPSLTSWTQLRPRLMAMDAALPRAPVL